MVNSPGIPSHFGSELAGRTSRLMLYALVAVVLMTLDYRGRWIDQVRAQAGLLVEPIVLLIETPFAFVAQAREGLSSRRHMIAERREMRRALTELSARILLLEELGRENSELRLLLDAADRVESDFLAAEIKQVDLNPFSHRVLINRGRRDGLVPGQAVVDAHGVVGQIDEVFLHSARVILLTDPDHAVPVRVQRTDLRTIAYGSGLTALMRLNDLPMNVDLEAGDVLVTSGLGGVFPPGLPVAQVESVRRAPGEAFAGAELQPLGRLDRSRHLLVLELLDSVQAPPAELEPLLEDEAAAPETALTESPVEEIEP